LTSKTKGTIYLGGLGTGKSFILVLKSIMLALEKNRGLFLTYSLNNIRDNIIPLYREILQMLGYKENQDFVIVKSPSINVTILGTDVMLRTASDPNSLRGPSVNYVMYEEARELTKEAFDVGLGRLRKGHGLQWFITSTTRGKNWFYDIIKEEGLTDIFDSSYEYNDHCTVVRASTRTAPHLSDDYVRELERQYTTMFALQELDACIVEDGGTIVNPNWFKVLDLPKVTRGVRYWDLAVTTNVNSDYSCGCLMSNNNGRYHIGNITRVQLEYPDLRKHIIDTAILDGTGVTIVIETAGQQKAIYDDIRRSHELNNHIVKEHRPTKDKITRSYPVASQAEAGNISIQNEPWKKLLFNECAQFSVENVNKNKYHDDVVDSMTGAYTMCSKNTAITYSRI
jgi:predicted phage terminase large subunit-like protein